MSVVGIVGFINSGKSTVGDYIVQRFDFERDSFAAPLKDCAAIVFGWDRKLLEGDTTESREWRNQPDEWWEERLDWKNHGGSKISKRFTPRVLLQYWGTEVFRYGFFNEIWIASLENRIRGKSNIVITDCRFQNEIDVIRKNGGKIYRVKRGPEPEWYDLALAANSKTFTHSYRAFDELKDMGIHQSEFDWVGTDIDHTFDNNGTLLDLYSQIEEIMK